MREAAGAVAGTMASTCGEKTLAWVRLRGDGEEAEGAARLRRLMECLPANTMVLVLGTKPGGVSGGGTESSAASSEAVAQPLAENDDDDDDEEEEAIVVVEEEEEAGGEEAKESRGEQRSRRKHKAQAGWVVCGVADGAVSR